MFNQDISVHYVVQDNKSVIRANFVLLHILIYVKKTWMCPEASTFIQNGFVSAIYTKQIPLINTLEFQISQVWYTSDTEIIKYMFKSLNHMQVSVY